MWLPILGFMLRRLLKIRHDNLPLHIKLGKHGAPVGPNTSYNISCTKRLHYAEEMWMKCGLICKPFAWQTTGTYIRTCTLQANMSCRTLWKLKNNYSLSSSITMPSASKTERSYFKDASPSFKHFGFSVQDT